MAWIVRVGVGEWFSQSEMENNANIIYDYFVNTLHSTVESVCGVLGNMEEESTLNPGNKQGDAEDDPNIGWGLIQWSPATSLTDWCTEQGYTWYDGNAQLLKINFEGVNGISYYPTIDYPYSWSEFLQLTDVRTATLAYHANRERSGDTPEQLEERVEAGINWYQYFEHHPPTPTRRKRKTSIAVLIGKKGAMLGL